MIYWIGNSENWDKPIHPISPAPSGDGFPYAFPLVEEAVLEVAFSRLYGAYKRLSREAAINCTSRFALRTALTRELNPYWQKMPNFGDGIVVKAPASCQNEGIGFALHNQYSRRLAQYDRIVGNIGVVEQYIPGPQYEADGVVIGGKVHLLAWVLQEGENGKITRYIHWLRFPEAPAEVIEATVKALGLDNCPFCFEMKRETDEQGRWKIIDAHARLGEDRRLWTNQAELFECIDRIISG
jgi:hypothetical protein